MSEQPAAAPFEAAPEQATTEAYSRREESYSDAGTGSDDDLHVWRPLLNEWDNEYRVVYTATNSRHFSGRLYVVKSGMHNGKPTLAAPKHFECKWTDKSTGGDTDGSFWKAIPPTGYVALSDVAVHMSNYGLKPGVTKPAHEIDSKFMCVLKRICHRHELGSIMWTDAGSGGTYDGAIWRIRGGSAGMRVSEGKNDRPSEDQYIQLY